MACAKALLLIGSTIDAEIASAIATETLGNSDIIKNYKTDFTFLFILITYIVLVSLLFHYNPKEIINKYGTLSIITALFGIFFILMMMFFIKRREEEFGPQLNSNNQNQIQHYPTVINFYIIIFVSILILAIPVFVIFVSVLLT